MPPHKLKMYNKLMMSVVQVVYLKKDFKHHFEQTLMVTARLSKEKKCNWPKMLEKAMANQMTTFKDKSQKL